jgi:hypothetical protein
MRGDHSRRALASLGAIARRAILPVLGGLAKAAPAQAQTMFPAGSETASAGIVSAKLSWDAGEAGPENPRLEITRNGSVAFSRAIPKVVCEGCQLSPVTGGDLQAVDLDGDGEA